MSTPSKDIIAAYGLTPRDVDIAIKALITMIDGNLKVGNSFPCEYSTCTLPMAHPSIPPSAFSKIHFQPHVENKNHTLET